MDSTHCDGSQGFGNNEGEGGWGASVPVGDTPCVVVTTHLGDFSLTRHRDLHVGGAVDNEVAGTVDHHRGRPCRAPSSYQTSGSTDSTGMD